MTFLFTDIESSTSLWDAYPVEMGYALELHDQILRAAIEEHDGSVFSTAGDSFSSAFAIPASALACAVAIQRALREQRWPTGIEMSVRMGMHVGVALEREGDYFGGAVNRAARVMGLAHGGQVLVSLPVEKLVRDELPRGTELVDLGEHELRGLSRTEWLFQVCAEGLTAEFPPLRSGVEAGLDLPVAVTSFVGRHEEVKRVGAELRSDRGRLVTLTGVGGVGKTRLAMELGWSVSDEFPDGVWLVELAPATETGAVLAAVASTLDVRAQLNMTISEAIVDRLGMVRGLLILDNCEHVLDPVADLVGDILRGCSKMAVLTTSREPLAVEGERVWPVRSLDPVAEAVELFCDRAVAADPDFAIGDDEDLVAEVCARLDGIPLAIELAAARIRTFGVRLVAERLHDRFRLLRAGRRGGLERHRTLRATVDWSHRLLDDDERSLFDRLSVFVGSFDLSAAEVVCAGDGVLDELEVADLLARLVDKSLVAPVMSSGADRYRLLETLRQYGEEQLDTSDELAQLRDRHLAHYNAVGELAQAQFEGSENQEGRRRFETEWDNLRAAVDWALSSRDYTAAERIVASTSRYAFSAWREEVGEWASRILDLATPTDAEVYLAMASWAALNGEPDRVIQLGRQGLELLADPRHPKRALCWSAIAAGHSQLSQRQDTLDAITQLHRTLADASPFDRAVTASLAAMTCSHWDPALAPEFLQTARRAAAPLHNPAVDCQVEFWEARIASEAGHQEIAARAFTQIIEAAEKCGNRFVASGALWGLLRCATESGTASPNLFATTLRRFHASREWIQVLNVLEALALTWIDAGQLDDAAMVLGYLESNGLGYPTLADRRARARQLIENSPTARQSFDTSAEAHRDLIITRALTALRVDQGSN